MNVITKNGINLLITESRFKEVIHLLSFSCPSSQELIALNEYYSLFSLFQDMLSPNFASVLSYAYASSYATNKLFHSSTTISKIKSKSFRYISISVLLQSNSEERNKKNNSSFSKGTFPSLCLAVEKFILFVPGRRLRFLHMCIYVTIHLFYVFI